MRKFYLVVLAALIASPAIAGDLRMTFEEIPYQKFGPNGTAAQIIHVPPPRGVAAIAESEARDSQWISYCNPQVRVDDFGVGRYHYAKAGCEFGKSVD